MFGFRQNTVEICNKKPSTFTSVFAKTIRNIFKLYLELNNNVQKQ